MWSNHSDPVSPRSVSFPLFGEPRNWRRAPGPLSTGSNGRTKQWSNWFRRGFARVFTTAVASHRLARTESISFTNSSRVISRGARFESVFWRDRSLQHVLGRDGGGG